MAWDTELEELMPHTVTVRAAARPAADGSDAFSTSASTYQARVTTDPKAVRKAVGSETDIAAVAWVASTAAIAVGSKVGLPDGTFPAVKQSSLVADGDGAHHVKLLLGW